MPDAFDRVVAALASGNSAEEHRNGQAMRAAANALLQAGALPLDGMQDEAARWLARSDAIQRKPHAAAIPFRNRVLGAGYRMVAIAPGATTQFDQTFLAGQRARVAVVALTNSEFSLSVRGDDGQSVCAAASPKSRCDWVPAWTTRYAILLSNPGKIKSDYYVIMQ
ncbi:hypothetical protein [Novosphingobium sp.]|uniref:hypothetical protein n=1 Tax=Novosphingobium sp. TaxID=1874826 RepID=UPI0025D3927B|nr:hypothetical protein [Novosphingobium sp.]